MAILNLLCIGICAVIVTASDKAARVQALKEAIHTLSKAEAMEHLKQLRAEIEERPHQDKIDHFVVLLMENHAADNIFGCMNLTGFDGIPTEGRHLPIEPGNPSTRYATVTCGEAVNVCKGGPGYDLFGGKFACGPSKPNMGIYPYDPQSDNNSYCRGAHSTAIKMFAPKQLPVKAEIAKQFGIFNKLYTAVPSASTPNHLFIQSATSCGIVDNIIYSKCDGTTDTFPQFTIYDSMFVNNVSFGLYMNSTCGMPNKTGAVRPCSGVNPHSPDAGSTIYAPDVGMDGVARYKDRFFSQERFYSAAAAGTLPSLSWILPSEQACDHPCFDMAKGERLLKDVYEALRAGPKWNKTLFLVTYDDAGAYYDHVIPPSDGVPAPEAPCNVAKNFTCPGRQPFDFRRLGLRTSSMLISPLVSKGVVFQEPAGPFNNSQFELTSVPATLKNLFNLTGFLTKRDEWAGSFHELLLDTPRTDAPMHLPAAPPPAKPWIPPPGCHDPACGNPAPGEWGSQETAGADFSALTATEATDQSAAPQHCGLQERTCHGADAISRHQKNKIHLFSKLLSLQEPEVQHMTRRDAGQWLVAAWDQWVAMDQPNANAM